jgi:drug/metabolite transporter (DMT)-like permease
MLYICVASVLGYVLWNIVIRYHSVSALSVIRFSIPLFSVMFSGILLNEEVLRWNYMLALGIILAAILLNVASFKKTKNN